MTLSEKLYLFCLREIRTKIWGIEFQSIHPPTPWPLRPLLTDIICQTNRLYWARYVHWHFVWNNMSYAFHNYKNTTLLNTTMNVFIQQKIPVCMWQGKSLKRETLANINFKPVLWPRNPTSPTARNLICAPDLDWVHSATTEARGRA